jgi:hypothetical protein
MCDNEFYLDLMMERTLSVCLKYALPERVWILLLKIMLPYLTVV